LAATVSNVTEGLSTDRQPAYAPDGSRVLFTSNRSGNVDLFSYEFGPRRLTQLTEHAADDWDGAYTPDGRSILWSSDRGGNLEIWMADADGSNPHQVSHDGVDAENPTMTADREWVVYTSSHPERPGIVRVRPDGTDTTMVVAGNLSNPEVSPDGRYVLYLSLNSSLLHNEIHIAEIATGRVLDFKIEIDFEPHSPNVTFGRARWLPGGEAIAFVGLDDDGLTGLFIQDFVPGQDTIDTRHPLREAPDNAVVESFGIAPDGRRFAISTLRRVSALNLADRLGGLR
jgi:Tol biopolymer transport system component